MIYLMMYEDQFFIIFTYVIFSALGTFVKNYFYSLHIFYLFVINNIWSWYFFLDPNIPEVYISD